MPTTSPSDLIRQKRLLLQTNSSHVQESTSGLAPRLAVTLPVRISAINNSKFVQTPSQKLFTTGVKLSTVTHVKLI